MHRVTLVRPSGPRAAVTRLSLVTMMVAGCEFAAPAQPERGDLPVTKVSGSVLTDGNVLGLPSRLAVVGDYVVVIDKAADSVFHAFDRRTGSHVRPFGRRGGGPGEFRAAWTLDPVPGRDDELRVYDPGNGRLTTLSLSRLVQRGQPMHTTMLPINREASLLGPIAMANGRYLSTGLFAEGRLAVLDGEGQRIGTVGETPPGPTGVPPHVRQHAYQATVAAHPDRSRLVLVTRHASQLEIVGAEGLERTVAGPVPVDIDFSAATPNSGFVLAEDARYGYVDVTATAGRIYALFSGRKAGPFKERTSFGQYVHVFTWDGEFQEVLELDEAVLAISVDQEGRTLFGLRYDPVPAIVAFAVNAEPQFQQLASANPLSD